MSNNRIPVRAVIQNYANHNDSVVEFKRGVNWIVGTNDSGKSQLLKALLTVLLNENIPTDARSIGADGKPHPGAMRIRVDFDDGTFIERVSSSKANTIEIGSPDQKSEPLSRVADATEEVRLLTGIVNHPTMPRLFPQVQRLGDPLLLADNSQGKSTYQILAGLLFPTKIPQLRKAVASDLRSAQTENKFLAQRLSLITDNPIYSEESLDSCESKIQSLKDRTESTEGYTRLVTAVLRGTHELAGIPAVESETVEKIQRSREVLQGQLAAHDTAVASAVRLEGIIKAVRSVAGTPIPPPNSALKVAEHRSKAVLVQKIADGITAFQKSDLEVKAIENQLAGIERPSIAICESCNKLCLTGGNCGV